MRLYTARRTVIAALLLLCLPVVTFASQYVTTLSIGTIREYRAEPNGTLYINGQPVSGTVRLEVRRSAPAPTPAPSATPRPSVAPTPAPSATPSPTPPPSQDARAARVVEFVNAERVRAGLPALRINARLTQAAQLHSEDQARTGRMSHTGSDGSTVSTRVTRTGYSWSSVGENVAYGYRTPEEVMAGWMSSAGHRANILGTGYTEIGVGVAADANGRLYWTQVFARPR